MHKILRLGAGVATLLFVIEDKAAAPVPDQPAAPIETQLSLIGDEAPLAEHADMIAEEVDAITPPDALAAEMAETDRVGEDTTAIELAPDQPELAIEPQAAEETSANENAAI